MKKATSKIRARETINVVRGEIEGKKGKGAKMLDEGSRGKLARAGQTIGKSRQSGYADRASARHPQNGG